MKDYDQWALIFAVAVLVLAVLGFGGLAGVAIDIAKILFGLGMTIYKKVT